MDNSSYRWLSVKFYINSGKNNIKVVSDNGYNSIDGFFVGPTGSFSRYLQNIELFLQKSKINLVESSNITKNQFNNLVANLNLTLSQQGFSVSGSGKIILIRNSFISTFSSNNLIEPSANGLDTIVIGSSQSSPVLHFYDTNFYLFAVLIPTLSILMGFVITFTRRFKINEKK
jgi:hypothetical protein